jgi:hypothetical protein
LKKVNVIIGGHMNRLFIVTIFLLLFLPLAESYKIFPNPPPSTSPQSQSANMANVQNIQSEKSGTVYVTSSESHLISSSDNNDKIGISKSISPNSMDNCLVGKIFCLSTEIKGTKWTMNDLVIKDSVESPLRIANLSETPYIVDPLRDISTPISQNNYNFSNNTLHIHMDALKPNYRIKYAYNIISNKSGRYESNIILRIGNHSTTTDLDYSKEIEIGYPEFDVNVDLNKMDVYDEDLILHDRLHITYNILYKSANSGPISCDISFENSPSNGYDIYLDENEKYTGQVIRKELNSANYTPIEVYVGYKDTGSKRIPGILVNGKPYIFDYGINVSHRIFYLTEKFYPLISIIALIVTLILTFRDLKIMREQINTMISNNKTKVYFKNSPRHKSKSIIRYKKMKSKFKQ